MEKSLKLKNNTISLSKIKFDAFSASEKWIGYFYAKDLKDDSLMKYSTDLVLDFFKEDFHGFFGVSALSYKTLDVEEIYSRFKGVMTKELLDYYISIYYQAVDDGFLSRYEGVIERYYETDFRFVEDILPANALVLYFDNRKLLSYCEMIMAFYFFPIIGQACFLINSKLQIALYPHDDVGFGVISLGDDPSLAVEFLKFCGNDNRFGVHIEN